MEGEVIAMMGKGKRHKVGSDGEKRKARDVECLSRSVEKKNCNVDDGRREEHYIPRIKYYFKKPQSEAENSSEGSLKGIAERTRHPVWKECMHASKRPCKHAVRTRRRLPHHQQGCSPLGSC